MESDIEIKKYYQYITRTHGTHGRREHKHSSSKHAEHERRNFNREERWYTATPPTRNSSSESCDISAEEPDLEPVHSHVDAVTNADLSVPTVYQSPCHGGTGTEGGEGSAPW